MTLHSQRANDRYGNPEYRRNRKLAFKRDGHRCCFVEKGRRCSVTDRLTAHHIKPIADGGTHDLTNLVTLCNPHNQRVDAELRRKRPRADRKSRPEESHPGITN